MTSVKKSRSLGDFLGSYLRFQKLVELLKTPIEKVSFFGSFLERQERRKAKFLPNIFTCPTLKQLKELGTSVILTKKSSKIL